MAHSFVGIAACPAEPEVAVVIDVLRAFTTAAWAFELGVERIVLTDDLSEALRIKAQIPGALAIRDGEITAGFDLTNSPARLQRFDDLRGRTIVQRTSNGTIGAVAARRAKLLLCTSFAVASATTRAIQSSGLDEVCFVVSGEEGMADEDRACADYIAALLEDSSTAPDPYLARIGASNAAARIRRMLSEGSQAFDPDDIDVCTRADTFDFAMRASEEDGLLVLRKVPTNQGTR
jgi:2-phosphosulfolactate phosphatase